ncbi:MAG TPA: hypothetical protein VGC54_12245 [Planctomycetota bacterium]
MVAAFLLLLLAAPQAAAAQEPAAALVPQVGAPFPGFEFPRFGTEERASLAAFRGRKLLLVQFASW